MKDDNEKLTGKELLAYIILFALAFAFFVWYGSRSLALALG